MNKLLFSYTTGWQSGGNLNPQSKPLNHYCPMHHHQSFEMVYYPTGKGRSDTERGDRLLYSPGSVIIYPPHLKHDQRTEEPGIDICVHFDVMGIIPEALSGAISIGDMHDRAVEADLMRLSAPESKMSETRKAIFSHRVGAVVLTLLELDSADKNADEPAPALHASQAHSFIIEKYAVIDCLDEVAQAIGVSHDRLRHVFRARYGVGLLKFLQQTRLERAADLLIHSTLPLKNICGMCGFANERYLCSAFKQWSGYTPGDFRAKREG